MIFKKITFLFFLLIFFTSCEKEDNSICSINGIEETIIATSFTEWNYFSVTDTGFVEIGSLTDEQAQSSYDWDIAMMRNHFRTNSGLSGPANGGAVMFEEIWIVTHL